MCRYLYLASDLELPLVESSDKEPLLSIKPLEEQDMTVLKHFSMKHVVYAGSFEGCSCGFSYDFSDMSDDEDRKEQEKRKASVVALLGYIKQQLVGAISLELYECWADEQGHDMQGHSYIDLGTLSLGETFGFEDNTLIRITDSSSGDTQ